MTRPKQSLKGNLVLLGVFLLPAVLALLVYMATGSKAAGWFTLAITTSALLAALVGFVVSINVSRSRPSLSRAETAWLGILVGIVALVLATVPLIVTR